jgi:uncharacterized protein YndB with AHSA1/START domain
VSGDRARVSVKVDLPPEQAFEIFTAQIDQWWRRGMKFRHSDSAASLLCVEGKVGGRLFESFDVSGRSHVIEVGRVRVWDPPHTLAFSWRNSNFAPHESTQVEVDFQPSGAGTLVTVTHSGLASLHSDHPARHGLQGAEFCRMIGLWWGDQVSSLRMRCRVSS